VRAYGPGFRVLMSMFFHFAVAVEAASSCGFSSLLWCEDLLHADWLEYCVAKNKSPSTARFLDLLD
jgi:hypothetical protein